jgi:hypothetical protein
VAGRLFHTGAAAALQTKSPLVERRPFVLNQFSAGREALELIFFFEPFVVFLVVHFLILPFIAFFVFVPIVVAGSGAVGGGIGYAAGIRVDFHCGGGAQPFIDKDTIDIMTFDAGHLKSS